MRNLYRVIDRRVNVWVTGVFFCIFVVVATGFDWLINSTLYGYGLTFDNGWWQFDQALYIALFQAVIWALFYANRNLYFLGLTQTFFWSSTQDIFYYLIWGRGVFPSTAWAWMPNGPLNVNYLLRLESWTSTNQILFSTTSIIIAASISAVVYFKVKR